MTNQNKQTKTNRFEIAKLAVIALMIAAMLGCFSVVSAAQEAPTLSMAEHFSIGLTDVAESLKGTPDLAPTEDVSFLSSFWGDLLIVLFVILGLLLIMLLIGLYLNAKNDKKAEEKTEAEPEEKSEEVDTDTEEESKVVYTDGDPEDAVDLEEYLDEEDADRVEAVAMMDENDEDDGD